MFKLIKPALSLLLFTLATRVSAQEVRIFSNEFLSIGLGARAQGMANSLVASTNDVYSLYWNPAGLADLESEMQVAYKHAEYFAGIANYDFGGIAKKLKDSAALAFGVVRFGVDDIPNTLYLVEPDGSVNYDNVTLFSVADYAFFVSYGRRIGRLAYGGSAKVIHRRVGPFARAWGFGLDAGIKYRMGTRFTLAAMARDVTSTFNAWTITMSDADREALLLTGNEMPENSIEIALPKLLMGFSYLQPLGSSLALRSELGADVSFDGQRNTLLSSKTLSLEPHLGLELAFKSVFFLRGGIGNLQRETIWDPLQTGNRTSFQPNVGAGFYLKYLAIDYAYTDIGDNSVAPYSHMVSLRFDLSKDIFDKNVGNKDLEETATP
ncbi:MAG: hypothetical protein HYZ16_07105 [Bacteroidetes bacterium]|nr:hypothetical protein [Bacteroidota bacterium]